MNTKTQMVDERCAMLARIAELDAQYAAAGNFVAGETAKDIQAHVVRLADKSIAERTRELSAQDGAL